MLISLSAAANFIISKYQNSDKIPYTEIINRKFQTPVSRTILGKKFTSSDTYQFNIDAKNPTNNRFETLTIYVKPGTVFKVE